MKNSCRIAAGALEHIKSQVKIGMTAEEADKIIHNYIISQGAYPSGVGFMGFPKSVCISTNDSTHNINFTQLSAMGYQIHEFFRKVIGQTSM